MSKSPSYNLGRVYGLIAARYPQQLQHQASKYCMRPLDGLGLAMSILARDKALFAELNDDIAGLVDDIPPDYPSITSLKEQGDWWIGYYTASQRTSGWDIAEARKAKGMTQEELAEAIGATRPEVVRWERGIVKPRAETLAKIKSVLADGGEDDEEGQPG